MELLRQVVRSHHQHRQALRSAADLLGVEHGDRGLEHRPDLRAIRSTVALQGSFDGPDFLRGVHLRDDDAIGASCSDRCEVIVVPRRADAVGPNGDLSIAITPSSEHRTGALTGFSLGVGGHGVFEVEDEGVGGNSLGLLERPLVGGRHVQHAATWAKVGRHVSPPRRWWRRALRAQGHGRRGRWRVPP